MSLALIEEAVIQYRCRNTYVHVSTPEVEAIIYHTAAKQVL